MNCSGCDGPWHKGGCQQCPAYRLASTNAVQTYPQQNTQEQITLYKVSQARTEPMPITVHVSSLTSMKEITVSTNSVAEIPAASSDILECLVYHPGSLLPSPVIPEALNGNSMILLRNIPVTIHLQQRQYGVLHFFQDIAGAIFSWRAAKGLKLCQCTTQSY